LASTDPNYEPTVPQRLVTEALEADPSAAAAEYLAEFRSDIESFVSREAVEACITWGEQERPYQAGVSYKAFTDPSGGSSDSFTLAIAHRDKDGIGVLDALRDVRPPFSPESVVVEFAALLKSYKVSKVTGDRYAGEWPREQFRKHHIEYLPSDRAKSDLYRDALPLLNSKKVRLLGDRKLFSELISLERRTSRGGRDSIDHPPSAHDDLANAACGVLVNLGVSNYDVRKLASGLSEMMYGSG
jgi:hypothetical protein